MTQDKPLSAFWYLFLIAFIEGGAVMAVELIGAKIIAPYYGTSLYVWSSVLAITLGGLTTGYFFGGMISAKYPFKRILYLILLISAILVALLPVSAPAIMDATLVMMKHQLKTGIVISCMVYLFPPLVCFGMVSPMIIRLVSTRLERVGRAAGTVYAISTCGGILFTFLMGFYFIPYIGLKISSYITAILLGIFPVEYFIRSAIAGRLSKA